MKSREAIGSVAAAVAAPIVIVAIAVLLLLNPLWVSFEQKRAEVTVWTGYSQTQVDQVTGSILSDLVFGPPNFTVSVDGTQVLDPKEVEHMKDVRTVFFGLGAVALLAVVVLAGLIAAGRRTRWLWRGIRAGATALAIGVVVVGVGALLFFDQVFLIFHEIFFPPGSFSFDPGSEKLVQLFPDDFWSDTTVVLGIVVLILGIALRYVAGRMVAEREAAS